MNFPDQNHINRVRDALWQRSSNRASVMVGSGFSRNSVPIGPQVTALPTWEEVTNQLHQELYPQENDTGYPNQLRTAQEYEAGFGRGALHQALRRLVRHEEHRPGRMHQRLLQLPWQDIFTTNWDTLLERTPSEASEAVQRHYSIINSVDEIPMAIRPRIVKLHGSFPAQFPLVVTEEDYRTYPTRFAPFVNTVQQAMMESIFLLIGFSSDDPNFLEWSGWVRDNLGASAPKIYLAGYLQLSPHRRRMLENRDIVTIDLAQHPNANRWAEKSHEYATQWLLHTLENGEPYRITDWPVRLSPRRRPIPDHLKPVDEPTTTWPKQEPDPPYRHLKLWGSPDAHLLAQAVKEATTIWEHNRNVYPGWLVLPSSNRHVLSNNADSWASATLESAEHLTPTERLQAIRELVWRKKILLEPFEQDLLTATESTLEMFDCHNRTIDGVEAPEADWETIRKNWRNTTTELLVEYRWNYNEEAFRRRVEDLRKFAYEDLEIQQCIFQEQCLWALYDSEFVELNRLLADWQSESNDPVWTMRKSAILAEMGRNDEAEQLRRQAMEAIRAMPAEERTVAGPSREGWAILPTAGWHNHQTINGRMNELAALKCDAMHERDVISRRIDRNKEEKDPPSFDVGTRTAQHRLYTNHEQLVAAYQAIRLAEVAGLPPYVSLPYDLPSNETTRIKSTVAAGFLRRAAEELADWHHELAIRLILRASYRNSDTTLQRVLTRTRVATFPQGQAESLAKCCWNAIAQDMPNLLNQTDQPRIDVAIEALSRLVVRLPADQAETAFEQALEFCQNHQLAEGGGETAIQHLLHRSWEAMPREYRRRRAIGILNAPIAGLDGPKPLSGHSWPDPADLLSRPSELLERTPENELQWQTAISITIRGLTSNPAVRHRASKRMVLLVLSGQLTEDETRRIVAALWDERYTGSKELPGGVAFYDWEFLTFPEPAPGITDERFRNRWLSDNGELVDSNTIAISPSSANGLNHNLNDVKSRLWQVGCAMHILRENGQQMELSDEEKQYLLELVETWADTPTPEGFPLEDPMFGNIYIFQVREVARALPEVFQEIHPPDTALGEKIFQKMRGLIESQIPVFELAPSIVKTIPTRLADVATMLRVGMTSDTGVSATNATSGTLLWLSESSEPTSRTPTIPDDLVREIGVSIAFRRSASLAGALQGARIIFDNGAEASKEIIRHSVLDGLDYLRTELSYDRAHDTTEEVPWLRLLCVRLAVAIAKNGQDQHPVVARWLEIAKEDPLPEVRNAVNE